VIGLSRLRTHTRSAIARAGGFVAGLAFMLLASAAIQYDEIIAPKLSAGWSGVADELTRKITGA
jgi:hypothetical protein